jgi:hypothetical protein
MERANKAGLISHKAWGLQLVHGVAVNTDEDILDKQTLYECPFKNEIVWDGRKTAMRRFTDFDDCECFVDEVDVAAGFDTSEMTLSR